MLIYLDTCSIQRPLDDRSQPRINLEAEAIVTVPDLIESGDIDLLSSELLEFEIRQTPDTIRGIRAREILSVAGMSAEVSEAVRTRARELMSSVGVMAMDALHVAVAMEYHATYFCTCDDKLLKKLKALNKTLPPYFVSPLELAAEVTSL
uniref:Predicted nucleic acid-binding protein, contains PIN domain n=1 Tax=Candidatus Kentrum sp. FM TaxID=2126340 RepID=A0A450VV87_9GAMM|nr:MAG: Predicted nucleic acid-binding protein, contains PIN domain [Candidatus Kentron sp. FM]VFJ50381.1 MAG: Predicted nucleic acid-binding protein, contains PIN domain [Candidatus Kentron sp. FM]VFK08675.1 MAG: Predicted nucleic acid-binding protein, contains PIN domain [Candidatus Kentron sp. FM]